MNVSKPSPEFGSLTGGMPRMLALGGLALVAAAVFVAPGLAQTPSRQVPAGSPIDRDAPRQLPAVSPSGMNLRPLESGEVPNVPIAVRHVEITGATLFADELSVYIAGLTGAAVPLTTLNKARQDILRHYRSRGYALTAVSLSVERTTGNVRFNVTEGRIAAVKLDGDIGPAGRMVLRFLNRLTEYQAINTATLERWLLLAQDVPGVSLSTVLEPSKDDPGALTLVAQVSLKRFSGQVSLDNRAFELTGPIQGLAVLSINSLTSWGDKTDVSFYHTFPNSQNFGQVSSEWFVGSSGLKVKLYGGAGVSNPTGSLASLKYNGFTDIFGAQISYPVIRSRQQTLSVYGSFDALESTVYTGLQVSAQSSADEVRALRVGADYIGSDLWLGDSRPATNQISGRLSRGLDILGGFHGTALPPSTARQNERHNFTAMKLELMRTQTLFTPWDGASVALQGLVTGQWTNDILPPAEQFYLGGARFTRGYYSGQAPGDKALAATAELQLNTTINMTWLISQAEVASQFYAFYDWGQTWQNQSADFATRLVSAGTGVRLQVTKNVEVDLEALARLTRRPPPATSELNGIGMYWRVIGRF